MKADCQELQEDLVKVAGNKEANQILVDKLSRLWVKVFTSLCEVVRMEGRTTPSCVCGDGLWADSSVEGAPPSTEAIKAN